jgi:3-oxoacyl-[acyl-carrier-protein] synthase-3
VQASRSGNSAIYVHGIGHFHPPNLIDSAFLEALDIGTTAKWIDEKLGIAERRTVLDLDYIRTTRNADFRAADEASAYTNADTAEIAAAMAFKRAGLSPRDIGVVISGSSTPRHLVPPEACILADRFGLEVPAMDINGACNSFLTQASMLAAMGENAPADFYLIVQAENMTRHVSYNDRATAAIMGDCTTVVIVSTRVPAKMQVRDISLGCASSLWREAVIPVATHFYQNGREVKKFAVSKMLESVESQPDRDSMHFVFHQANYRLLQEVVGLAKIPEERHFCNVNRFGNCASAGSTSVLSQNWDLFHSQPMRINLAVIGGGLSWGMATILT